MAGLRPGERDDRPHRHVKLIDFGSVRAGLAEDSAPAPDAAPRPTAPECFDRQRPGPQAELFALAVLTYQMLSGQLPYPPPVPRLPARPTGATAARCRCATPARPAWLEAVLAAPCTPAARRHEPLSEFTHALAAPGPAVSRPACR
jgi:serine/threonine protein kinase